jgi:hypothetical protein
VPKSQSIFHCPNDHQNDHTSGREGHKAIDQAQDSLEAWQATARAWHCQDFGHLVRPTKRLRLKAAAASRTDRLKGHLGLPKNPGVLRQQKPKVLEGLYPPPFGIQELGDGIELRQSQILLVDLEVPKAILELGDGALSVQATEQKNLLMWPKLPIVGGYER